VESQGRAAGVDWRKGHMRALEEVDKDFGCRRENVLGEVLRTVLVAGHHKAVGRRRVVGAENNVLAADSRLAVEEDNLEAGRREEDHRNSRRLTL